MLDSGSDLFFQIGSVDLTSTNNNFEITSLTSGWQIAIGGKGTLFYSQIAVSNGKGRKYT